MVFQMINFDVGGCLGGDAQEEQCPLVESLLSCCLHHLVVVECRLSMLRRAPNWHSVLPPEGGFGTPNGECQVPLRWNVGHWSEVHCQYVASHDPQMVATPTSIMLPTSKARRQRREMGSVYGRLEIHRPLVSEPLPDSEKPSKLIKSSWFILKFSTKKTGKRKERYRSVFWMPRSCSLG